jgi:hypothetical protein
VDSFDENYFDNIDLKNYNDGKKNNGGGQTVCSRIRKGHYVN